MNTPHTADTANTSASSARACGRSERPSHACGPRQCGPMGHRMDGAFAPFGPWRWRDTPVNIEETDSAFVLRLLAPGLDKSALQLSVQGDVLTLRHQAPANADADGRRYTRLERPVRDFEREFALNGQVQIDAIEATYAEGMLTVLLPKTPEAMQPARDIPVR